MGLSLSRFRRSEETCDCEDVHPFDVNGYQWPPIHDTCGYALRGRQLTRVTRNSVYDVCDTIDSSVSLTTDGVVAKIARRAIRLRLITPEAIMAIVCVHYLQGRARYRPRETEV